MRYRNQQFETFYNEVLPERSCGILRRLARRPYHIWMFFLGSVLSIPLIALPKMLRDRRVRLLNVQIILSFLGASAVTVSWYFPHYFAPVTATIFILLTQLMRHLRVWEFWDRPVGIYLTRLIVVLAIARPFVVAGYAIAHPITDWRNRRAQIVEELNVTPGKHLVLVCYRPQHIVEHEWVYNAADLDGARIVWARVIPGRDLGPLLGYFKDRSVWVLQADASPAELEPYSGTQESVQTLAASVPRKP